MAVLRICSFRDGGLRPEAFARCACGAFDVMAVRPGSEDERGPGDILVARGEAAVAWCFGCWPFLAPQEEVAVGWTHEYEPFDLGKWTPDFLLMDLGVLVEVKPHLKFNSVTWKKMSDACTKKGLFDDIEGEIMGLMLTRLAPVTTDENPAASLGWSSFLESANPAPVYLGWVPRSNKPEFEASLIKPDADGGWDSLPCGGGSWANPDRPRFFRRHAMELWADATTRVQWIAKNDKSS